MAKTIYEKSNEITSVRLNSFSKVYAHKVLSSLESSCDREENAQILLDYLCKKFKIERVTLSVSLHTSGFYKRIGDLKEKLGN